MHNAGWMLAGLLLLARPASAQVQIGDAWKFNLDGNLGYNYNGAIDNGASSHGMGLYGNANLRGSFYNPNFLNFSVSPYADHNHSNSLYGSLGNSEGVNANLNLFSGSHFPGSVYFGRGSNSSSEFGLPSSTVGLAEHGTNQNFGVDWSAILPGLPTLTASYAIGNGTSEVYGTQDQSQQNTKTFNLLSTYNIAGYRLSGSIMHRNVNTQLAEFVDGSTLPVHSDGASTDYQINASHKLPLSGGFGISFGHNNYDYDYFDSYRSTSSGSGNSFGAGANFRPVTKLTVSTNFNYTDSLLGSIPQPMQNGVVQVVSLGTFRSMLMGANAYYQVLPSLSVNGEVNHTVQTFLGQTYSSTQYGGGANYSTTQRFLGSFTFAFSAFDYATQLGNQGMGFSGNLNFTRRVRNWDVDANFGYAQGVQTLIVIYTSSSYNWVSNVRRRLANQTYFSAGYGGSHSGITQASGFSNSSERASGALTWRKYNLNGFYSKADGTAVLTATGLTAVPTNLPPTVFAPGSLMTYNSKAVGANLGGVIRSRLTFSLAYADSNGTTIDPLSDIRVSTQLYNAVMQFRMRKIYMDGGFTRLRQGVGTVGTAPVNVTSFYVGFTRWFNFF
jgi:hypothetical protein